MMPAQIKGYSGGPRYTRRLGLHLFGDDLEPRQWRGPEGRRDCDIGGVAAARHDDASDARMIVPGVQGKPPPAEIDLEPGAEIHRRGIDRHADIAEITGAIARGNVHAAAERD